MHRIIPWAQKRVGLLFLVGMIGGLMFTHVLLYIGCKSQPAACHHDGGFHAVPLDLLAQHSEDRSVRLVAYFRDHYQEEEARHAEISARLDALTPGHVTGATLVLLEMLSIPFFDYDMRDQHRVTFTLPWESAARDFPIESLIWGAYVEAREAR